MIKHDAYPASITGTPPGLQYALATGEQGRYRRVHAQAEQDGRKSAAARLTYAGCGVAWRLAGGPVRCCSVLGWSSARACRPGRMRSWLLTRVNPDAVARAQQLSIAAARAQQRLGQGPARSQRGERFPRVALVGGLRPLASRAHRRASHHTKTRYAFVDGDFRRVHRMGIIACHYRTAEWRHREIEACRS